jgi:2,4-dienoyl-CoA reductase-like NADH-dependent reductase (Old Yellow Enzyme family)
MDKEKRVSILFEPTNIMNMSLRNRFVRSATYDGCADDGYVTENQTNLYSMLAKGGIGLIITGITYVHSSGQISKFQNSIAGEEFISGLKKLTHTVHHEGSKIAVQLFHAGREARFPRSREEVPFAPSLLETDPYHEREYRAMRQDEIWQVIRAFGDGARRAKEAGFDAVQLHAAHGYLLSQFLSPFTNRRHDEWGGNLENRLRLHREIYQDIRRKVGEDYPVLIKIGVQDGFPEGLEFSEGKQAAKLLATLGYNALEISQGLRGPGYENTEFKTNINDINHEAYYRHWCREIKKEVDVPVILVGGLRTFKRMEEIIQNNESDFVSLSRPFIREPDILNKWKRDHSYRARCISCNQCFSGLLKRETLRCFQEDREKHREAKDIHNEN